MCRCTRRPTAKPRHWPKSATELEVDPAGERRELTDIYVHRGLEAGLAKQVAEQLMAHDALAAHARDELGFSARSAGASAAGRGRFRRRASRPGAVIPLLVAALASPPYGHSAHGRRHRSCACFRWAPLSAKAAGARMFTGGVARDRLERFGHGSDRGRGALVGSLS